VPRRPMTRTPQEPRLMRDQHALAIASRRDPVRGHALLDAVAGCPDVDALARLLLSDTATVTVAVDGGSEGEGASDRD
jgi:hypothetical protein